MPDLFIPMEVIERVIAGKAHQGDARAMLDACATLSRTLVALCRDGVTDADHDTFEAARRTAVEISAAQMAGSIELASARLGFVWGRADTPSPFAAAG